MLQVTIKKKLGNFLLDVDFCMDGGVFAILGASGCGKSMTLKCIAGIETPDEGYIAINDVVVFDSKNHINVPIQKKTLWLYVSKLCFISEYDSEGISHVQFKIKQYVNRKQNRS